MNHAKTFLYWTAGMAMSGVLFAFVQVGLFFIRASETVAHAQLAIGFPLQNSSKPVSVYGTLVELDKTLAVLQGLGFKAQSAVAATEPVLRQARITLQQAGPVIKEVGKIRQDVKPVLMAAQKTVEQVGQIRNDLQPVIDNLTETTITANGITWDFAQTSRLMFNCKESPRTCVAPRVAGTLRAWEVTSGDLSKTMRLAPLFMATAQETNGHFAGIAKDVHLTADRLTAPKTKRQRVWEVVKLGTYAGSRFISP